VAINRQALASLQGCQFGHEAKAAELAPPASVTQFGASRGGANRVASRSSMVKHRRGSLSASCWISSRSLPYSGRSRRQTRAGSFGRAAHGHKPTATTVGQGGANDESPRFDANDQVGLERSTTWGSWRITSPQAQRDRAFQRTITEGQDAGLGKSGISPHQSAQIGRLDWMFEWCGKGLAHARRQARDESVGRCISHHGPMLSFGRVSLLNLP